MSPLSKRLSSVLVILSFFIIAGGVRGFLGLEGFEGNNNNVFQEYNRYIFFVSYFFMIVALLLNGVNESEIRYYLLLFITVFLFIFITKDIEYSLFKFAALLGASFLSLYLVALGNVAKSLKLCFAALSIVCIAGIAISVLLPEFGVHSDYEHFGKWKGSFGHKNWFGKLAFLSLFVSVALLYLNVNRLLRYQCYILIGLSLFIIYKTSSSTSLFTTVITISLFCCANFFHSFKQSKFLLMTVIIVASAFIQLVLNLILIVVGKDSSFSGRDLIWEGAFQAISDKPLFGYGFYGFWKPEREGVWNYMPEEWIDKLSDTHSGYLGMLIDFGFVFSSLFFILYFFIMFKSFELGKTYKNFYIYFCWLLTYAVYNLVETSFFRINDVLFVFTVFVLGSFLVSLRKVNSPI